MNEEENSEQDKVRAFLSMNPGHEDEESHLQRLIEDSKARRAKI